MNKKPAPPRASDIPDLHFEVDLIGAEGNKDPEYNFALAFIRTQDVVAAYRAAFDPDEDDDKKAFILGQAMFNTANVQVHLASIYERLGQRLEITHRGLAARLWMSLHQTEAKDLPKALQTLHQLLNAQVAKPDEDDGPRGGGSGPTVIVNVAVAPGQPQPTALSAPVPGDASVPIDVTPTMVEVEVPLPQMEGA